MVLRSDLPKDHGWRMNPICQRNWGTTEKGWTWCVLPSGHTGVCCGANGPKREDQAFFEDQPEAAAFLSAQRVKQEKADARKANL